MVKGGRRSKMNSLPPSPKRGGGLGRPALRQQQIAFLVLSPLFRTKRLISVLFPN
ncbi:uncharacterized protein J3R85_000564 [Psidium guajava]|nr:uncharacterized protein J3R85_000564 [Psidium guajava]